MDKVQYNNVINHILKHELNRFKTDTVENVRKIFKAMGVSLPNGNISEIHKILKTNKYMGWRLCTMEQAREASNNGIAAVGINDSKMAVIVVDNENLIPTNDYVISVDKCTAATVSGFEFYSYGYGITTVSDYNTDYRGLPILTNRQLNLLYYNTSFYKEAADLYMIPWKLIAAVHYRESKLERTGPKNGNGPYQIWGSSYPIGALTDAQFQNATNAAAEFIKRKSNGRDLTVSENIKYTLFAYNGMASAYKTQAINLGFSQAEANIGEGSPYVMNRADCWRDPTVEPVKSGRTWGQIKSDGGSLVYPANTDYGAYVVYNAI